MGRTPSSRYQYPTARLGTGTQGRTRHGCPYGARTPLSLTISSGRLRLRRRGSRGVRWRRIRRWRWWGTGSRRPRKVFRGHRFHRGHTYLQVDVTLIPCLSLVVLPSRPEHLVFREFEQPGAPAVNLGYGQRHEGAAFVRGGEIQPGG